MRHPSSVKVLNLQGVELMLLETGGRCVCDLTADFALPFSCRRETVQVSNLWADLHSETQPGSSPAHTPENQKYSKPWEGERQGGDPVEVRRRQRERVEPQRHQPHLRKRVRLRRGCWQPPIHLEKPKRVRGWHGQGLPRQRGEAERARGWRLPPRAHQERTETDRKRPGTSG